MPRYQQGFDCNPECVQNGNCCDDYTSYCLASCVGRCGENDGISCSCDSGCTELGNCCADYTSACYAPQMTCQGHCGSDNVGCSCKRICQVFGGCCDDFQDVCLPSCKGKCGNHENEGCCACDQYCMSLGDCCHDYVRV